MDNAVPSEGVGLISVRHFIHIPEIRKDLKYSDYILEALSIILISKS